MDMLKSLNIRFDVDMLISIASLVLNTPELTNVKPLNSCFTHLSVI